MKLTEAKEKLFRARCIIFNINKNELHELIGLLRSVELDKLEEQIDNESFGIVEGKISMGARRRYRISDNPILVLASYIENDPPIFWSEAVKMAKTVLRLAVK